jgi:hypothetical protein
MVIRKRDMAYRKKQNPKFKHLRNKVKNMIKAAQINYTSKITHLKNKEDWKKLNNIVMTKSSSSMNLDYTPDELNQYFSTVASEEPMVPTNSIEDLPHQSIYVEYNDVLIALSKVGKSGGVPYIHSWILRDYCMLLAKPLQTIFNASFDLGAVPNIFKMANITPIPKVSNPKQLGDFRPITVSSPILKIMERIVLQKWLKPLITEENFADQYAFIPLKGRGCTTALTYTYGKILQEIDKGDNVNLLLVDFSKAFDRAPLPKILDVLISHKASLNCITWIHSFIENRQLRVKVNSNYSNFIKVSSGTPQGGVISPILFALLVSTLQPLSSSCMYVKYADDLTIIQTITNNNNELQKEINHVESWCKINSMKINITKTKVIHISRKKHQNPPLIQLNNEYIAVSSSVKLLGIQIQPDLKWNNHVLLTTQKANRRMFQLIRLKRAGCSTTVLEAVYQSHIRSVLTYAFPAICNISHTLLTHLIKVERRAYMIIGCKPSIRLTNFCDNQCKRLHNSIISYDDHPLRQLLMNINPRCNRSNRTVIVPAGNSTLYINSFIKYFL